MEQILPESKKGSLPLPYSTRVFLEEDRTAMSQPIPNPREVFLEQQAQPILENCRKQSLAHRTLHFSVRGAGPGPDEMTGPKHPAAPARRGPQDAGPWSCHAPRSTL